MSYMFHVPDEAYRVLRLVAERQGLTPEDLFEEWVRTQTESINISSVISRAPSRLTRFIGAFEAEEPDLILCHDHYLAEAAADAHDTGR